MAVTPRDPATVPGLDGRSRWIDLDGPLHYLDLGGPAGAPVVVCVHGLSGSAVNWSAIAPLLTDRYRLLAPDLAGHGLTRSVGRGTTVSANRILLHRFLESMPGTPAMLMAYATPGLGQLLMVRRRRLSPEALVRSTMSLCCADPSRVPATVIAEHVAVARQRAAFTELNRDLAVAARSAVSAAGSGLGLPYRRLMRSITAPVLLLHGERDRLVPVAAARAAARANPTWSVRLLPGVGHVPQLEAPQTVAAEVRGWLDSNPSATGRR